MRYGQIGIIEKINKKINLSTNIKLMNYKLLFIICWILLLLLLVSTIVCTWCTKKKVDSSVEQFNLEYDLAIVAIFRNEEDYLEEWIKFHLGQGFDHIYLYNNDLDVDKYHFLNKYIDSLTIVDWQYKKNHGAYSVQRQAYTHCIQTYGHQFRWLALLDIDEFMHPLDPNTDKIDRSKTVKDIVSQLSTKDVKSVRVPRYDYGNSGHMSRPYNDVTKSYTMREKNCSAFKAIANSDFIDCSKRFGRVHDFPYLTKPGKIINRLLWYQGNEPAKCPANFKSEVPLAISHYYTKSYEEYIKRCMLWKSNPVNLYGVRDKCYNYKDFMKKNKNETTGFL